MPADQRRRIEPRRGGSPADLVPRRGLDHPAAGRARRAAESAAAQSFGRGDVQRLRPGAADLRRDVGRRPQLQPDGPGDLEDGRHERAAASIVASSAALARVGPCRTAGPSPPACRGRRPSPPGTDRAPRSSGAAPSSAGDRAHGGRRSRAAPSGRSAARSCLGDLHRRAVVRLEHQQPVGPGVGRLDQVEQVGEVAERLRHLLAPTSTNPLCTQWRAKRVPERDGLGPLVLVVREGQVDGRRRGCRSPHRAGRGTSPRTRCATRPAVAPRRRPRRLVGLGLLPQHEVGRMALLSSPTIVRSPPAGAQLVERLVGQQAVVRRHRATDR